ncbi:CUB domain-containing protein 2-like [Ciona intestinalis]
MKKSLFSAFIFLVLAGVKDADACSMLSLTGGPGYSSPSYSSPGHPNNNPHNLDCYYRINAQSSSNVIQVTFSQFNLEKHSRCNFDYVAVYEGSSTSSRLIGKYCGTNSSFSVTGRGRDMYLHYHTDSSVSSSGFQFRFNIRASRTPSCDQLSIGGGPGTGSITSPNYPRNYPDNADCRYRINAGSATRNITLRFTAFNLEANSDCRYDYVEVRTGFKGNWAQTARKYCGSTVPATQVITGQQYVYIQFFTDASVTRSGFNLQWTISGAGDCDQLNLGGAPGSNGVILSPNYPREYPKNIDCKYRVRSSCSNNIINFRFNAFNIEAHSQCRFMLSVIWSYSITRLSHELSQQRPKQLRHSTTKCENYPPSIHDFHLEELNPSAGTTALLSGGTLSMAHSWINSAERNQLPS